MKITYFEVLQNIMTIGNDIDTAARYLAVSDFCPSFRAKQNECDPLCDDCTECWKKQLEKEVHKIEIYG